MAKADLEPFEDDPFINEMIDLASTDEDEANRLVEEADEQGSQRGLLLEAYRKQRSAREVAKANVAANRGFGFKAGDRVLKKPAVFNPDVLVIHSLNNDETVATCGTEQGPKLAVLDVPVADLEPAPPGRNGWMS